MQTQTKPTFNFTPGPWHVGEHHGKPAVFDAYPAVIARPGFVDTETLPETMATMRLIAKAPELYDTLKRLLDAATGELPENWVILDEARTLLAEIEGA